MSIEVWIAFVVAAAVVLVIPGPTILLVISHAIAHGRRSVLPLAAGVTLGDFTAMTLSFVGLGAILAISAAFFTLLKFVGAGYLIYLGVRLWRSNPAEGAASVTIARESTRSLFRKAFVVTALNPKGIAFFVVFLPQFVTPERQLLLQLLLLGITFLILAFVNAALYAFFAGYLRDRMDSPGVRHWFHRLGGSVLVGAGIFTAALQRSS